MSIPRKTTFDRRLVEVVMEFEAACLDRSPPDPRQFAAAHSDLAPHLLREIAVREFDWRWKGGREDIVEVHLNRYPEFRGDDEFVLALLRIELAYLPGSPDPEKMVNRFPGLKDDIGLLLEAYDEAERDQTGAPGLLSHAPYTTLQRTLPHSPPTTAPHTNGKLEPGTTLNVDDRYRVIRLLSDAGGQKLVYEAQQVNPGRVVALKTPRNPARGREMLLEGQVVAQLEHQKIPPVMSLSDGTDALPILAEKYIPGTSWDRHLHDQRRCVAAAPTADQPTLRRDALRENLRYLQDVCDALAYAHSELQVIHRDLKPANVMLSRFNQTLGRFTEVYLVDWGLAVHVGPDPLDEVRAPHRTGVHGFSGTPSYAAPEMWVGAGERLSPATDVFLLGGLLYELITDTPPYTETNLVRLEMRGRLGRIPPPDQRAPDRSMPLELRQIAVRALATDPRDRYADAAEFARALEEYQRHAEAEEQCERARARRRQIREQLQDSSTAATRHTFISPLIDVANQFRQAAGSWETTGTPGPLENDAYRQALQDERDTRLELVELAEQAESYPLAEAQVEHVAALPMPFGEGVEAHRRRIQARAARRYRARRFLRVAAAALLVMSVGLVTLGLLFARTRDEAALESEQRRLAEGLRDLETHRANTAEARERYEANAKRRAEAATAAETKARNEATLLAADRQLLNDSLRWINLGAAAREERFDQGGATYFARAIRERDYPALRIPWSESLQRSLVPVATSSRLHLIGSMVYSRDGRYLLTGDFARNGDIRVWDLATGVQLRVLPGHPPPNNTAGASTVRKLMLDPRHPSRMFSAGLDGTVRLTDFITGEVVAESPPDAKKPQYLGLGISAKPVPGRGYVLVTGDHLGRLVFWNPDTLRPVRVVDEANADGTFAVAVHPESGVCASGGSDNKVRLWDLDGNPLHVLESPEQTAPKAFVNDLAFSPDGRFLVVARDALGVEVWDVSTRMLARTLKGVTTGKIAGKGKDRVYRLAFAPSGEVFATAADGTGRQWNPATGKAGPVVKHDPDLGGTAVTIGLAASPDGKEFATAGADATLRRWDAATGQQLTTLEGNQAGELLGCTTSAFDPESGELITGGGGTTPVLHRWDVATLREKRTYTAGYKLEYDSPSILPTATVVAPGGARFAAGMMNGDMLVYETGTGKLVHKIKTAHEPIDDPRFDGTLYKPAITGLAWSPDGKRIASIGPNYQVKVWDSASFNLVAEWNARDPDAVPDEDKPATLPATPILFDPDNTHVITGTENGTLVRWDAQTTKAAGRFPAHTSAVTALALSRDGKWLASGGHGEIVLWDWGRMRAVRLTSLPPVMDWRRYGGWKANTDRVTVGIEQVLATGVRSLAFSPDIGLLAAIQRDGTVSVLSTTSGGVLHRGIGHAVHAPSVATHACYFTTSRELLTVGDDGAVVKWDLPAQTVGVRKRSFWLEWLTVAPDGEWTGVDDPLLNGAARWSRTEPDGWPLPEQPDGGRNITPAGLKDWPRAAQEDADPPPDRPMLAEYTSDGARLLIANQTGSVVVWDRKSNVVAATFRQPRPFRPKETVPVVTTLAVHPHSEIAATNTQGPNRIARWASNPFTNPNSGGGHGSPNEQSRVDLWHVKDGSVLKSLEWPGRRVATVAFRPNGTDLATVDESGRVTVWDWRAGQRRFTAQGAPRPGGGIGLVYAPDGSHLVQAGLGGSIFVFDAETGQQRQVWAGHLTVPIEGPELQVTVHGVAFRRDGILATCGGDGTVRLWRRDDRGMYEPLAVWSTLKIGSYRAFPAKVVGPVVRPGPAGPVLTHASGELHHVRFTPDGQYLVTWGILTPVHVIHVEAALADQTRLTPAEITRETERVTGLRLDGSNLMVVERNRLLAPTPSD